MILESKLIELDKKLDEMSTWEFEPVSEPIKLMKELRTLIKDALQ